MVKMGGFGLKALGNEGERYPSAAQGANLLIERLARWADSIPFGNRTVPGALPRAE
jgi:hypothetical protein